MLVSLLTALLTEIHQRQHCGTLAAGGAAEPRPQAGEAVTTTWLFLCGMRLAWVWVLWQQKKRQGFVPVPPPATQVPHSRREPDASASERHGEPVPTRQNALVNGLAAAANKGGGAAYFIRLMCGWSCVMASFIKDA